MMFDESFSADDENAFTVYYRRSKSINKYIIDALKIKSEIPGPDLDFK